MINSNNIFAFILSLSSSILFAGTTGQVCTADHVVVPCKTTAWDVGIQALYLKTTYTGQFSYAADRIVATNVSEQNDLQVNQGWGFKLEGAYHFNTGNDLNLNWYHFNTSSSSTFLAGESPTTLGTVAYTIKPSWDAVNLELGQQIDVGNLKKMRIHGGVQYVQLKTTVDEIGISGIEESESLTMKFNGLGLRVGTDLFYNVVNNVSIYAGANTALVVGTGSFTVVETDPIIVENNSALTGSRLTVVPEIDLKVGAQCNHPFANGNLNFDIGYMFVNYFNGLHDGNGRMGDDTNFAFNGPYAGVKWVG